MARELPRWENEGISPPESLKSRGWQKGDKPPFQYLNWYMYNTYRVLEELQLTSLSTTELNVFRDDLLREIANRVFVFNNVAAMRADMSVKAGAFVETLGFYSPNDGGGARYLITNDATNPDGYFEFRMNNGLVARLLTSPTNSVNIRQIGARSQSGTTKYDTKPYVDAYLVHLRNSTEKASRLKLYVPAGIWAFSPMLLHRENGFSITGDYNFAHENLSMQGTIFTSLNDNQPYVICIGLATNTVMYNWEFGNIGISTADFNYNNGAYVTSAIKKVTRSAFVIQGAAFGRMLPMMFAAIDGTAYELTSSWEIDFDKMTFRNIRDYTKSVMKFSNSIPELASYEPNITNLHFRVLDFEVICGDLVEFENDARFLNSNIETIVVEPAFADADQILALPAAGYNDATAKHFSIVRINGWLTGSTIGNILLNNFAWRYAVKDGVQYVYDTVIGTYSNLGVIQVNVNSIAIHGLNKNYDIIRNFTNSPGSTGEFNIGEVRSTSVHDFGGKFNVTRFPPINVGVVRQNNLFAGSSNLPPNVQPASKYANRSYTSVTQPWRGMLTYDEQAFAPNKLVIHPDSWLNEDVGDILQFANPKREVQIRAKIPAGQTRTFYVHGKVNGVDDDNTYDNVVMVGTGNYAWYPLLAANNKYDELTPIILNVVPNGANYYFDVLKFV